MRRPMPDRIMAVLPSLGGGGSDACDPRYAILDLDYHFGYPLGHILVTRDHPSVYNFFNATWVTQRPDGWADGLAPSKGALAPGQNCT